MPLISLVATDLDGTLFYDRENITNRDFSMLRHLKEQNVTVVFATGREMRLVTPALDHLTLWDIPQYIIHSGGSGLFTVNTRTDRCLAEMQPSTLHDIYARYHTLPVSFMLMQDDIMHTDKMTPILRQESALLHCPVVEEPDFSSILTRPNSKLVVCGTTQQLQQVLPILTADPDPRFAFHRSHDNYIDCYARGINKGTALLSLCEMLTVHIHQTLAVGDNLNDIELLQTAGLSACPGDGHPDIKSLVDYVACPAYEGAFADACEHFRLDLQNPSLKKI